MTSRGTSLPVPVRGYRYMCCDGEEHIRIDDRRLLDDYYTITRRCSTILAESSKCDTILAFPRCLHFSCLATSINQSIYRNFRAKFASSCMRDVNLGRKCDIQYLQMRRKFDQYRNTVPVYARARAYRRRPRGPGPFGIEASPVPVPVRYHTD